MGDYLVSVPASRIQTPVTQRSLPPSVLYFPSSCGLFHRCPPHVPSVRDSGNPGWCGGPRLGLLTLLKHTRISLPSLLPLPCFYVGNDILTRPSFGLEAPARSSPCLWLPNRTSHSLLSRACLLRPSHPYSPGSAPRPCCL